MRLLVKPRNDTVGGAMRSSTFRFILHFAFCILHFQITSEYDPKYVNASLLADSSQIIWMYSWE